MARPPRCGAVYARPGENAPRSCVRPRGHRGRHADGSPPPSAGYDARQRATRRQTMLSLGADTLERLDEAVDGGRAPSRSAAVDAAVSEWSERP